MANKPHGGAEQDVDSVTIPTGRPIDSETLFSRCMKNRALALSLLTELESSGNAYADSILVHALDGDQLSAAEAAHALKGAAAIIGADALAKHAAQVEYFPDHRDTVQLLQLANDLRSEMDRCLAYLPALRMDITRASWPQPTVAGPLS